MWATISSLPIGVMYCIIGLIGLCIFGFFCLSALTIFRKGKVKAGKVEFDAEPDIIPVPVETPALHSDAPEAPKDAGAGEVAK